MKQSYTTSSTLQNNVVPPMLLPIHMNMLPALVREGVQYDLTDLSTPCTDMVMIAVVAESLNILNLFHAGIHLGRGVAA
jgi:hypothetical protein